MGEPLVTILIPNFKTLKLTKLCLRLVRKHTDPSKVHVIVIDNDSGDDSLEYLRGLKWIELIERKARQDDTPALSHSRALDMALEKVTTPHVLSIHTDTLFKDPGAIDLLLEELNRDPSIAGVGSWKLEPPPSFTKRLGKSAEYLLRGVLYRLKGDAARLKDMEEQKRSGYYSLFGQGNAVENVGGKGYYYLRSHCALYRMDLIRKFGLTFTGDGDTAGKEMHLRLTDEGYQMVFLSAGFLGRYIVHINHATMVLHPELGTGKKNIAKGTRRINRELAKLDADRILLDDSLDR